MGQLEEACQTFGRALATDGMRLGSQSVEEEATVRFALAQTLFAMGQWDLAAEEISLAVRTSQRRQKQHRFSDWYSKEKRKALGRYLLPDPISPNHPGCVNELGGLVKIDHE